MSDIAISVQNVTKLYKLYDKPSDRFVESLGLTKKKKYKEHYALHDLSFDIYRGECIGIIGTNGAGKSTILKIITGVLNPTEGNVDINGRISALLELGAGFNMEYTGIENVYLNGTMIGFTREEIDAKMDAILEFADIGEFIHQPVKTYSSGMFVRLAFAVAINIEPEILIVDEALSVGDVFFQAKCYKKFEEFKAMGKTILFVSHDLSSISKYCDRAILLNKGAKYTEGRPKEIIDIYKKLLVGVDAVNDVNNSNGEKNNLVETKLWKEGIFVNEDVSDYGNSKAKIIDFGIFDYNNNLSNTVEEGKEYQIKIRVKFIKNVKDPIVAYTIRDLKGNELTGTNTMYENRSIYDSQAGTVVTVSFKQKMKLRGGDYLLSLGCTGFTNGEFVVYNRLYDVCSLTVISERNIVGYFNSDSVVNVDVEK